MNWIKFFETWAILLAVVWVFTFAAYFFGPLGIIAMITTGFIALFYAALKRDE